MTDESSPMPVAAATTARVGRRTAALTRSRDTVGRLHQTGQLPTFDRVYLKRELTQIAVLSGGLLALILVLWLVMR